MIAAHLAGTYLAVLGAVLPLRVSAVHSVSAEVLFAEPALHRVTIAADLITPITRRSVELQAWH